MIDTTRMGAVWYIGPRTVDLFSFIGITMIEKRLHGESYITTRGGRAVDIPHEYANLSRLAWHFGALMHEPAANKLMC